MKHIRTQSYEEAMSSPVLSQITLNEDYEILAISGSENIVTEQPKLLSKSVVTK